MAYWNNIYFVSFKNVLKNLCLIEGNKLQSILVLKFLLLFTYYTVVLCCKLKISCSQNFFNFWHRLRVIRENGVNDYQKFTFLSKYDAIRPKFLGCWTNLERYSNCYSCSRNEKKKIKVGKYYMTFGCINTFSPSDLQGYGVS